MRIKIKVSNIELVAELLENNTANKIADILPIKSKANIWGDEIYFEIPIHIDLEDSAKEIVEKGDLGFWPSGDCFCIFFGPTPTSKGSKIRPASAVSVFGMVKGDLEPLRQVKQGQDIFIKAI